MEYGKFNSAEELLKGYTELEKSFTQKCQELAALKQDIETQRQNASGTSEQSPPQLDEEQSQQSSGTSGQPSPQEGSEQSPADDTATVPAPENADSLTESQSAEQQTVIPPRVMTGGGNVSMALPNRPKTLKEASDLAKKYFN